MDCSGMMNEWMDGQTIVFKGTDFEEKNVPQTIWFGADPLSPFGQCPNIINIILADGFPYLQSHI